MNRQKSKGDQFERDVVNVMREARALREGVDGAQEQAANSGDPYGVAVVKRRLKGADEAYAVLPLKVFLKLIS